MSWEEQQAAQQTARPTSRLPEPPPALSSLPVVLRVPRFVGVQKLRPVPHPRPHRGGTPGKLVACLVLSAAVLLLLRWHAWLISPEPLPPAPAAAPVEEIETLPPLCPARAPAPDPEPAYVPGKHDGRLSAGAGGAAPQVVPPGMGGLR